MMSPSDGSPVDPAKDFLDRYTKNPERWIPERIAQDLQRAKEEQLSLND